MRKIIWVIIVLIGKQANKIMGHSLGNMAAILFKTFESIGKRVEEYP
jgi:hypothetical protein